MEMASYLAGERWSDHPRCTHPLLASVARLVNDLTSDDHRPRLAELIPSVIGLTTDDPRADVCIALRCATTALPIAAAERQNALAVSVLAAERALDALEGRRPGRLAAASVRALESAPLAARWAGNFARGLDVSVDGFRRFGAPNCVRVAVAGIGEACVPDPDERLHDLLVDVIADCASICARDDVPATDQPRRDQEPSNAGGGAAAASRDRDVRSPLIVRLLTRGEPR